MKILMIFLLAATVAQAKGKLTTDQQLTKIKDSSGNFGYQFVLKVKEYNEAAETKDLFAYANGTEKNKVCDYVIKGGVTKGLNWIKNEWKRKATFQQLQELQKAGLIHQILFSQWPAKFNGKDYCAMSFVRVFTTDGWLLHLDYNRLGD